MKDIWKLFIIFCRIGGFTFGGGYAMLPIIQEEIVKDKGWATEQQVLDYYALGQCTPGIIAINTATLIGYKKKGIPGGIAATLGMVFPSLIIISLIATFFYQFQEYKIIQHAFNGIKVGVVALLVYTTSEMWKKVIKNWIGIVIVIISFSLLAFLHISPVIIILSSALLGVIMQIIKQKKLNPRR